MALFDVTNPAQPVQMFTEVIGGSGTYSELLYDHKALLFDREKDLLAFPIQIYDYMPREDAEPLDPTQPSTQEFTGAYVYTLTLENGFQLRGKISHPATTETYEYTTTRCETDPITDPIINEETCTEETTTDSWTNPDVIRRLLYIEDILYSIGEKWLRAGDIATTEQKAIVGME